MSNPAGPSPCISSGMRWQPAAHAQGGAGKPGGRAKPGKATRQNTGPCVRGGQGPGWVAWLLPNQKALDKASAHLPPPSSDSPQCSSPPQQGTQAVLRWLFAN